MSPQPRALLSLLLLGACIIEAPTSAGREGGTRPPAAPPAEVRSGANFGGKVELVSATLNPGVARTGDSLRVGLSFRVLEAMDRDYSIFVHVEDVDGRVDRINVDHPPRLKPTTQWQAGEVVRDEFDVPVPPGLPVRGLNLIVGLWDPRTDERLPIQNRDQVRHDNRDRLFVATVQVQQ